MENDSIAKRVKDSIAEAIPSIHYINVDDESDGLCDGGAKLIITVVSDSFIDMTTIGRHRKIQMILKESNLMAGIHALTLNTWTVSQYEAKNILVSSG